MSITPAQPIQTPQSVQIHPLAELREALFEAGMFRRRNLNLAHENHTLQQRVQELERQVAATSTATAHREGEPT